MYHLSSLAIPGRTSVMSMDTPSTRGRIANDVTEVLATVRRRWRWTAACSTAAILLSAAALVMGAPRYVATTQLVVDPRGLEVVEKDLTPRAQTSDVNTAIIETQTQVLVSDVVLRPVVERERLHDDPEFNGTPNNALGRAKAAFKAAWLPSREADPVLVALSTLRKRVRVGRSPASYVIDLSVSTSDPNRSATLARAIAETFTEVQSGARRSMARRASEALTSRLQELRDRVKEAENNVERFKAENRIVGANGRLVNEQQLADLSNQLIAAHARTSESRSRYEQIERTRRAGGVPDATTEAVQSPAIGQLRARYAEVKSLQEDLATKLGSRHPELASLRAQSASLRQAIADEVGRLASAARADYERALSHREALARSFGDLTGESNSVNSLLVRLRELEREAQASRAVYESFLNRVRETREQQEIDTGNTRIITPALPPLQPVGLPALLLLSLAGALGMSFGAITAVARDYLDGKLHTPRQASTATGLPVLAVVPECKRAATLDELSDRRPGAAQAYSRLHDLLSEPDVQPPRIVVVTSPKNRTSKSQVALNLALVAGEKGEKVLLVDADLATSFLTQVAGPIPGPSLSDVLLDRVALSAATRPLHDGPVQFLASLAGHVPLNAWTNATISRTLIDAAETFDLVVIDAGLSEEGSSIRPLVNSATQVVLVGRAEQTTLREIEHFRTGLGGLAAKVVGLAFVTPGSSKPSRYPHPAPVWG